MKQVAIVGSGAAGCYITAELLRASKDSRISVIERLPTPFGLVRYGVAPDHQGTKNISRIFERALGRDEVRFFGNVEVGRDVTLDELRSMYDAVVWATGAPHDRRLGIPGETLAGVYASGAFVNWYNGHPEHVAVDIGATRSVVVIGNGNVSLDVARVLAKTPAEIAGSDIGPGVSAVLAALPLEAIHVVGRRGPAAAKFTPEELAELGRLARATPRADDAQAVFEARAAHPENKNLELLDSFTRDARAAPVNLVFHFGLRPVEILGAEHAEGVRFERADGSHVDLPAQLVITCIGYVSGPLDAQPEATPDIAPLYTAGWAARGSSGTIPTNRKEAQAIARQIAADVEAHGRGGADALQDLLHRHGTHVVDHAGWTRIDKAELARAGAERCRVKFEGLAELLEAGRAPE